MGKAQGFFNRHQQQNVWAMTGLIIFAELSRLTNLGQAYSLLMVLVAIMGGVPLVLRAVSALTYRVISLDRTIGGRQVVDRHGAANRHRPRRRKRRHRGGYGH